MQEALRHCRQLLRDADKDRFLATLFAPAHRRDALHALYAFDIETARVPMLARQPLAGEIRLQWWREVLDGIRIDEARAHPVASALLDLIERHAVAPEPLVALIDARRADLYDDEFADMTALDLHAHRTAAAIVATAARLLGAVAADVVQAAEHAGIALTVTDRLRGLALPAARRRRVVPAELLRRHGSGWRNIDAGDGTPGLAAALAEMRAHARRHVGLADAWMPRLPPAVLPAFLPVAVVPLHLARMEEPDYDPFRSPLEVPQWRRQWTLWRAARTGRLAR